MQIVELRPTFSLAGSPGVAYTYGGLPIGWVGSQKPGKYVSARAAESFGEP